MTELQLRELLENANSDDVVDFVSGELRQSYANGARMRDGKRGRARHRTSQPA